ncbi:hypothetical protein RxyAA322_23180 [Rubrobacter xylanophilus]|uniref:Uncharacterized protein n=1 Tax=Rubrobacter xylanophilus TaxID=49319 RepID=A0A510HKP0_9ACTN|nr:hypothetical protein RxyAA322_23180 [Rubrobacter xylanophilus]
MVAELVLGVALPGAQDPAQEAPEDELLGGDQARRRARQHGKERLLERPPPLLSLRPALAEAPEHERRTGREQEGLERHGGESGLPRLRVEERQGYKSEEQ